MKEAATPVTASAWCRDQAKSGGRIVLVPTMGALHAGHAALIRRARKAAGPRGAVVLSLFVNPTQFGPGEDLSRYPRTLGADRRICREEGVDLLFRPGVGAMYEPDASVGIRETSLSSGLCGASRPGHFDGVCTVVAKLFHIIGPDAAVFGEKDWQQVAVLRRMVRDLCFPVAVLAVPTVREPDGLAMSSRNRLLTPSARSAAPGILASLRMTAAEAGAGERSVARLVRSLERRLADIPGAQTDYARIVDAATLAPVKSLVPGAQARALVAVRFGPVRLIDNLALPHLRTP